MSDLIEVEDLTIRYETDRGPLQAVTDASFTLSENEFFGLVGESGSGKSTIARAIIGVLDKNGTIASGTVRYKGDEIQNYSEGKIRRDLRWKEIAFIPQSSMNSLDPIEKMSKQAIQLAKEKTDWTKTETIKELQDLFNLVGLDPERVYDYPFQFSGGMQQRAVIALSLLLNPSLIIADEPTTALDVIMQDQIFKYLNEIKRDKDVSLILITHDVSVVFENCDQMAVLHGGHISERGSVIDIYDNPSHPYTLLLLRSFPDVRHPKRDLEVIEGKPPRLYGTVTACTFADRCPWSKEECVQALPDIDPVTDDPGHFTSCIRTNEPEFEMKRRDDHGEMEPEASDD